MANTKPLTDAINQLVSRATDVATDPEVRSSVRRLGSDFKGLGSAVVGGWKGSGATTGAASSSGTATGEQPAASQPYGQQPSAEQPSAHEPPYGQQGDAYPPR